ncbi:hypothetical protein HNR55_002341 [Acetobacter lovaniensis]|jgi:hypothetical protein|uniref:Uncharacterized protein n=1 Tax=Acetobacter lovaniensis TaxID=104100 RepID=A0A841QFG5_9PROT|nr:hypothetical protein [Acetobacter lovaniensis]
MPRKTCHPAMGYVLPAGHGFLGALLKHVLQPVAWRAVQVMVCCHMRSSVMDAGPAGLPRPSVLKAQGGAFMECDMTGFKAFNFVLWFCRRRVMLIAVDHKRGKMDGSDLSADVPGF